MLALPALRVADCARSVAGSVEGMPAGFARLGARWRRARTCGGGSAATGGTPPLGRAPPGSCAGSGGALPDWALLKL